MYSAQNAISLTAAQLVNIFTTLNLVVMFLILFFRKNNTYPNRILAFILLLPGVSFFGNFFFYANDLMRFPGFIYVNQISSLLCVPLIDYYFKIFTGNKNYISKVLNTLSGLAICTCIFYLIRFYSVDEQIKRKIISGIITTHHPCHIIIIRSIFFR